VERKISRGKFLKAMGAASAAGSTLSILACQPNTTAQSSGGGGGGPEEKKLNFYNWTEYVAKSTVPSSRRKRAYRLRRTSTPRTRSF
jgi:spermidine/putrescine transport system substrate-binding protein